MKFERKLNLIKKIVRRKERTGRRCKAVKKSGVRSIREKRLEVNSLNVLNNHDSFVTFQSSLFQKDAQRLFHNCCNFFLYSSFINFKEEVNFIII